MVTPAYSVCASRGLILSATWWRHQMEIFSASLASSAGNSPVTGEFPAQRPVTRSFGVFINLRLKQQLSKQRRRRWFETSSRSSWRHCSEWEPKFPTHEICTRYQLVFVLLQFGTSRYYPYSDVIMSAMASQITGVWTVCSLVCSGKSENISKLGVIGLLRGIHRWPVDSPHKGPSNAENASIRWHHHYWCPSWLLHWYIQA